MTVWAPLSLLERGHRADLFLLLSVAQGGLRDSVYHPTSYVGLHNTESLFYTLTSVFNATYPSYCHSNARIEGLNWGRLLGRSHGIYGSVQQHTFCMHELCGCTAVCYAYISTGLWVQGWELSAPTPEAVVPAGLSDTWLYLLLLTYWSRSFAWVQLKSVCYWVYLYSLIELKGGGGLHLHGVKCSVFQGCASELASLVSLTWESIADNRLIM